MKPRFHGNARRFSSPTVLKGDAPFLGATVQEWDAAITGNMDQTLAQVKLRAQGNGPKRDASKATTSDLASVAGKRLAREK
jgi:hypothetical protein